MELKKLEEDAKEEAKKYMEIILNAIYFLLSQLNS